MVEKGVDVSKMVNLEYRKYPDHIPHWNPKSKEYIRDEMTE